ncbi:hypothetical protein GG344DRAFT_79103 [Lentinula edodes]|nr:hypothetical protein GG344DRAFT_79103 [Lentinula edodes]
MASNLTTPEETTPPTTGLHGIIIGGSISGLSAAIALRRAGHRVTVLEKDSTITEKLSRGFRIAPNLHKILCEWGLEAELKEISSKPKTMNMLSYNNGTYLGSLTWDQEVLKETGGEFRLTTYSALWTLLYRETISQGVCVRFGAKIVSLKTRSISPSVSLESGETVYADLLIGADGVNGLTRKYISASAVPPDDYAHNDQSCGKDQRAYGEAKPGARIESAKFKMFSASIPKKSIINDPQLAYLINRRENDMFVWIGHEHSAIGFPSGNSSDFFLSVYGLESGVQARDLQHVLYGAESSLLKLSRIASETFSSLTYAPLIHESVLETWVDGSLVVIGEAAHPLPPGSVQSCALSVEDGAVLARLFAPQSLSWRSKSCGLVSYIPTILAAFQSIRYQRCASVQTREVGIIHYMTMPGSSEAERNVRDQGMRARRDLVELAVVPVPPEIADFFKTDFDDDVEEEEEGLCYQVKNTNLTANTGDRLEISPEWVEASEVFGYQAEEEAEEWWATWGRYQIQTEVSPAVAIGGNDETVCNFFQKLTTSDPLHSNSSIAPHSPYTLPSTSISEENWNHTPACTSAEFLTHKLIGSSEDGCGCCFLI